MPRHVQTTVQLVYKRNAQPKSSVFLSFVSLFLRYKSFMCFSSPIPVAPLKCGRKGHLSPIRAA